MIIISCCFNSIVEITCLAKIINKDITIKNKTNKKLVYFSFASILLLTYESVILFAKRLFLTEIDTVETKLLTYRKRYSEYWYGISSYIYIKYEFMKNLIVFLITTILWGNISAQEDIIVLLKDKKFYDDEATAFVVEIPQAEYKTVLKAWTKYLKDMPKEKVLVENAEISINKKFIPKIANDSLDINSYVKEYNGHIVLAVSFKLRGKYISKNSEEEVFYPTKNFVRDFAVEQYQEAVKDELKEETRKHDKLDADLNVLIRANDNFIDEIKQAKREILTNKDLITLNEMDQSSKVLQIQTQKEIVYRLVNTPGDEQKEATKNLRKIEGDFKKMQNKSKSFHNKILSLETKIRVNKRAIENNEKEQKFIKLDKDDQEYKVRKVQKKLDGIK